MALKYKLNEEGEKAILEKRSVEDFKDIVLNKIKIPLTNFDNRNNDFMSDNEVKEYSFSRALKASITGDWDKAGYEREVSREIENQTKKDSRGFYVPHQILRRDLSTTNTNGLIGTTHLGGSFIDILRNKMIISKLGGTVLTGLFGNVAIPKQTSSGTAYWIAEGEDVKDSEFKIEMISLTPKTIACATAYTRQMLLQSNPSIEALVMKDLALNIALGADKAIIAGDGKNGQPLGILNMSRIGNIDCSSGVNWSKVVEFETKIAEVDADVETMHYVSGAGVTGKLKSTPKTEYGNTFLLDNGNVNGYGHRRTNQVPTNAMLFGDFSQIVSGLWGGLDIMIDPYTKASSGATVIRAFQSMDVALRHNESFCISKNIE